MSISDVDPSKTPDALAEEQLQQELLGLFAIDTQNYLQRYNQIAEQLYPSSWTGDIQELYRCIHTIKGGAVTVAAEAVLQVATVIEDLLSDLRYLEIAPPLDDQNLQQILLETGELLTGTLDIVGEKDQVLAQIEPILGRLHYLHDRVREQYLPAWDEQKQVHQEFAEQGLDLVVLELEIALERAPSQGMVLEMTQVIAQQTVAQLHQIGTDLQLEAGWFELLNDAETLLKRPENGLWRSQWPRLFNAFKSCAKLSGNPVAFSLERTESLLVDDAIDESIEPADVPPFSLTDTELGAIPDFSQFAEPDEITSSALDGVGTFLDNLGFDDLAIDYIADQVTDQAPERAVNLDDIAPLTDPWLIEEDEFTDALNEFDASDPNLSPTNGQFEPVDQSLHELLQDSFDAHATQTPSDPTDPEFEPFLSQSDNAIEQPLTDSIDAATHEQIDAPFDVFIDSVVGDRDLADISDQPEPDIPLSSALEVEADAADSISWAESAVDFSTPPQDTRADALTPAEATDRLADSIVSERATWAAKADTEDPSPQPAMRSPVALERSGDVLPDKVQIPVPLEKLDQSAQYLIETMLTARMAKGFYQTLQNQITQIVSLAQEGAQYITQLRQIQDEYALLDDLRNNTQGPTPERYRQGYTTINRLLETSLRLSELGTEAERTALQTAEGLQRLDSNLLKLQNTVEDSRLVPFQNLGFRARAILRDLITRYGKPAQLRVDGEQIELDVSTARQLEPALLHLIRNAYDHGLESPEQRLAQGKPEHGNLLLSLKRRGNSFQLYLKDDGCGIDAAAIQTRAEALGLPLTQTQTPADLIAVICQPGFSSETQVSEISGRGVGMDIVATQMARLGGKLSVETTPGVGTTFQLQFPVPHLLVPCLMLQAGDRIFAIPTEDIKTTTLLDSLNVTPVNDASSLYSRKIQIDEETIPVLDLLDYWRPRPTNRTLPETAVGVYIHPPDVEHGVWLVADDLLDQSDLLINPLPKPLIDPVGLMGVSLQTDGSLIPVIEATALAEKLLAPSSPSTATDETPPEFDSIAEAESSVILIVDDAALIRRRVEASLSAYGYITHTCADGLEAWKWLQKYPRPMLIITDIEMPNMDGFTLTDRCRQAGISTPVLVISSRLSEEWFTEAKRLGATDYLTKGFSTLELVNKVKSLVSVEA